jgi:hypothetical protein
MLRLSFRPICSSVGEAKVVPSLILPLEHLLLRSRFRCRVLKHQFSTDFSFSIVRLAKTSTPFSDHCSWIFCAGQIRSVAAIFFSQWIFSPAAIFRLCFPGLVILLGNFLIARQSASLGIGSE